MARLLIVLALLGGASLSHLVLAEEVMVTGVAALGSGGVEVARQAAVSDALRQASIAGGAVLESVSIAGSGEAGRGLEATRVTALGAVKKHEIEREWREGDLYHVTLRVEVAGETDKRTAAACGENDQARYRKKIAATRFDVVNFPAVANIPDINKGFPRELIRRLEAQGQAIPGKIGVGLALPPLNAAPHGASNTGTVRTAADQTDSQFLVSGYLFAAPGGDVGVEVVVYDGVSGTQLSRRQYGIPVGASLKKQPPMFASAAFFASEAGQRFEELLGKAVSGLHDDLACQPFTARIVGIEGRKISMDAGGSARLESGDRLFVYRNDLLKRVVDRDGKQILGATQTPVGTVTLTHVQPLFAVGELSVDPLRSGIRVGDFVRMEAMPPAPAAAKEEKVAPPTTENVKKPSRSKVRKAKSH